MWIIASVASSCYAYTWDIKMDWGLFDSKAGDNKFLREEIVYSGTVSSLLLNPFITLIIHITTSPYFQLGFCKFYALFQKRSIFQWIYYFAIIEDLILRFGWTLSMSLIEAGFVESELMVTILSPLEVFRRFMWNFFRLENEHLNNCGKFRAVRDISVAPIDQSDQVINKI